MTQSPKYRIESEDPEKVVIRDVGPWDAHQTVTNGVEQVVEELAPMLRGRKLFYWDSEGEYDEIVVEDGKFVRFAPGCGRENFD